MTVIDRTNFNALVDDDGSNTLGTVWNKNQIKIVLLDPIDGSFATIDSVAAGKAPLASPTFTGTLTAPNIQATATLQVNSFTMYEPYAGYFGLWRAGPGNFILWSPAGQFMPSAYELDWTTGAANASVDVRLRRRAAKTLTLDDGAGGVARLEAPIVPIVVTLTDGATVALDAGTLANTYRLSAAGDRTIAAPTNPTAGQKITIAHVASGGANRTLTLTTGSAGAFRFGSDLAALTATVSGKTDYIGAIYNGVDSRWDVVAYMKGF